MAQFVDRYLAAVKNQVATTLRPDNLADVAQRHSLYTERVLSFLSVESRDLPALTQTAHMAYRPLLRALLEMVDNHPVLREELEETLVVNKLGPADRAVIQKAISYLLQRNDTAAHSLALRIGQVELELQTSFLNSIATESMPLPAQTNANEGISPEQKRRLTTLLRSRYPEDRDIEIGAFKAIPGGFSKQTDLLDLINVTSLPSNVVLRIDKPDSPVETTVADEFQIIEAMYKSGVPVPRPLMLETDKSILGGAFVLVARVDGVAAGDAFDLADPSVSFGLSLAQALAKMHGVSETLVSKRIPGAISSVQDRMLSDINYYEQKWHASQQPSVTLEMVYGWLRANIASASGGLRAIVQRDVGCHNLLVKNGKVSAVLDWETALIGDPAQDIGYVWHTVIQQCRGRHLSPNTNVPAAIVLRNLKSFSIVFGATSG